MSKCLLIVYHSQSGTTEQMLDAVLAGTRHPDVDDVEVVVTKALEVGAEAVKSAHAIILGTPENFGYMSGAMKYFFDRIYYDCLDHTQGLPYTMFIRAGNDGTGARASMERIITGLGWREVSDPVILVGDFTKHDLDQLKDLGMTLAMGLAVGVF